MSGLPGGWGAKWIGYTQHPAGDTGVFVFRRAFTCARPDLALPVRVSADQRYKLYVNGRFVGDGPQRGDLQHWHYESYDLAPFLRDGENVIVGLVWNFGRYAPMAQHSARLGFVLSGGEVSTPEEWQVAKVPGWGFDMLHSLVGPFYIDIGPGEIIDARDVPAALVSGEECGLDWKEPNEVCEAVDRGGGGGGTPWMLVPRSIPAMRCEPFSGKVCVCDTGSGERTALKPRQIEPGEPLLLDFGVLLNAHPRFKLSGKAGSQVSVTYAESLVAPDGTKGDRNAIVGKSAAGYQDRFILDGGERVFEPLWWRTFRYVQIESDGQAELLDVEAIETGYPLRVAASFESDHPSTDDIWDVAVRTVERCAGETYFDCPYYEQLQYAGDARIQALIGYYLSQDRALQRNAVEQISWSQMPDGLMQSRYPSRQPQVIPPFSLWWIMMLYDQWLYDRVRIPSRMVEQAHEVLGAWDRLIEGNQDEAFWAFADWVPEWKWGEPPGRARSSVHLFTKWMAEAALARIEGAEHRLRTIRHSLQTAERSEAGLAFHPQDTAREPSEHAAAVFRIAQSIAGLAPDPWPAKALENAAQSTYYFSYYNHVAQRPADYFAELGPWEGMVKNGLSTFAENPEPARSDCHAWSAHPILGFFQIVAGVTSVEEGWRKARIAPRPGRLRSFRALIPHPDGDLVVSLSDGRLEVDCPVPATLVWADEEREIEPGKHSF